MQNMIQLYKVHKKFTSTVIDIYIKINNLYIYIQIYTVIYIYTDIHSDLYIYIYRYTMIYIYI